MADVFYPKSGRSPLDDVEEDDDMYGGFDDGYAYDYAGGIDPYGNSVGYVPGTAAQLYGGVGVPGTAAQLYGGGDEYSVRPVTSVQAAGFRSAPQRGPFDPLNQGTAGFGSTRGPAPPLQKKSEMSPEAKALDMEVGVHRLLEESVQAATEGNSNVALELARECGKKERQLTKFRESNDMRDAVNLDLTYSVAFNLALQYEANGMFSESLNTYSLIIKKGQYPQAGRLRVNMGNIYFKQKNYPAAIKMYRMGLDQIPPTSLELRYRIMKNIGIAFVRMEKYQESLQAFHEVVEGSPDVQTAFNLLLCYYALGDPDRMKRGFSRLISTRFLPKSSKLSQSGGGIDSLDDVDDESDASDEVEILDDFDDDALKDELRERQKNALQLFLTAAKVIGPSINDGSWEEGIEFVIEQLKTEGSKLPCVNDLATEMEMYRALCFLRRKEVNEAISALRAFEKKDKKLKARASTNLSYLYLLEGDLGKASQCAQLAIEADRYNAKAQVNRGNVYFMQGDFVAAKNCYKEAMSLEADLVEAVYNLGIANKHLELFNEAIRNMKLALKLMPNSLDVFYQLGDIFDSIYEKELETSDEPDPENLDRAREYFDKLVHRAPTDPGALARLGQLYAKDGQESQAYHYFFESFRYFPVNMDVISWLGAYYVKNDMFERAIQFFDRASHIESDKVEWKLLVASCYRRIGIYDQAKAVYERIHREHPNNMECLKYLIPICQDMHLDDKVEEYITALRRLEERELELAARHSLINLENPSPVPGGDNNFTNEMSQDMNPSSSSYDSYGISSPGGVKGSRSTPGSFPARGSRDHVPSQIGNGSKRDDLDFGTDELDDLLPT